MGKAAFSQFMGLKNQLVIAAENSARDENLSSVLILTLCKDMDQQLRRAHKVVDIVDRANRKICVILLLYSVDMSGSVFAYVQLFAKGE